MTVKPELGDVLLGRNPKCWHHKGNINFRRLIAKHHLAYKACQARTEKSAIIGEIIREIEESGGRILFQEETTEEKSWVVVSDVNTIRSKISNALRDKYPSPSPARLMASRKIKERSARSKDLTLLAAAREQMVRDREQLQRQLLNHLGATNLFPGLPLMMMMPYNPAASLPLQYVSAALQVASSQGIPQPTPNLLPGFGITNSGSAFPRDCLLQPFPTEVQSSASQLGITIDTRRNVSDLGNQDADDRGAPTSLELPRCYNGVENPWEPATNRGGVRDDGVHIDDEEMFDLVYQLRVNCA